MTPLPPRVDVAIVGAGIAGLVAARRLAAAGRTTAVLEKGRALGGRARTQEQDGALLNLGPHALYKGGAAHKELRRIGLPLAGTPPDPRGAGIRDGELHRLPVDASSMFGTTVFGARGKRQTVSTLTRLQWDSLLGVEPHVSFAEWLDDRGLDPEVRQLFEALARVATYCHAPDRIGAAVALAQIRKAAWPGVIYLDGGWQTLADGVADAARSAGATVHPGAAVEGVERTQGAWTVTLRRGGELRAGAVLIAGAPETVGAVVGPDAEAAALGEGDRGDAIAAACLDIVLDRLPTPRATFGLGLDRPIYFSIPSLASRLTPDAGAVVQVARYLAPGEEVGPDARAELEATADLLLPGWRDAVKHSRFLPRIAVANRIPEASRGGAAGRPGVAVQGHDGLFVAGDWVGPEGHLLDAVVASAVAASSAILEAA